MRTCFSCFVLFFFLFIAGCGSSQGPVNETPVSKEAQFLKTEYAKKPVVYVARLIELKQKYGAAADPSIEKGFQELIAAHPPRPLDTFKESPNKALKVSAGNSELFFKNNYPSGTTLLSITQDGKPVMQEIFPFNSEKKIELKPGTYTVTLFIDRKFNDNVFGFSTILRPSSGNVYIGEFNIQSHQREGKCEAQYVTDDDMCLEAQFRVFDNCPGGKHLVETLCCDEGFNFIMDGQCSRYSDKAEGVACPAGYHQGGQGRCCPKDTMFINGACRKPEKETEAEK